MKKLKLNVTQFLKGHASTQSITKNRMPQSNGRKFERNVSKKEKIKLNYPNDDNVIESLSM